MQQNFLGESATNEINYSEIFLKNSLDLQEKEKSFYLKVEFLKKNLLNGNIEKFDDIFENLDEIYFELLKFTYPLGTYNLYGNNLQLKNLINDCEQKARIWFNDEILKNEEIYKKLLESFEFLKDKNLKNIQIKLIDDFLKDFKLSGAALFKKEKEKLSEILKKILETSFEFDKNIRDFNKKILIKKEDLAELPEEFINTLKINEDKLYEIGTDYPTINMIFTYCSCRETRKKLYELISKKAYPENIEVLEKLRILRNEYASVLGYETYTDLDLECSMAKNKNNVINFLNNLNDKTFEKAKVEVEEFKKFAKTYFKNEFEEIFPWDTSYISRFYEKENFNIDSEEISEYFPLDKTINKLLEIYSKFFGIILKTESCNKEDWCWNENLKKISLYEKESNKLLGIIFFDPFPRENKYGHACLSFIQPQKKNKNLQSLPISIMVCNFTKPTEKKESLLKHNEVITFFHEFGHAIHNTLSNNIEYAKLSMDNVPIDFVEIPSQLFEEWMWDFEILKLIGSHYKTGEKFTDEKINSIIKSKYFMDNLFYQRQVGLSFLSLRLFSENTDIKKIKKETYEKLASICNYDENNFMECSFGHLNGYGSKYYSYMWSLFYAYNIFDYIKKQNGLLDEKIGKKLSNQVLSLGNTVDAEKMINNFLKN